MSNVEPFEYLAGTGIYVFGTCMIGACIIAVAGGYKEKEIVQFL